MVDNSPTRDALQSFFVPCFDRKLNIFSHLSCPLLLPWCPHLLVIIIFAGNTVILLFCSYPQTTLHTGPGRAPAVWAYLYRGVRLELHLLLRFNFTQVILRQCYLRVSWEPHRYHHGMKWCGSICASQMCISSMPVWKSEPKRLSCSHRQPFLPFQLSSLKVLQARGWVLLDGCSPLRSKPAAHPAGGLGCWRSIGKEEVRESRKEGGSRNGSE